LLSIVAPQSGQNSSFSVILVPQFLQYLFIFLPLV
jgi:hypothetical protein